MRWMLVFITLLPAAAMADATDVASRSQSDAGSAPQAQAPIGDMKFASGRWTLTPALGVIQINTTTDTETSSLYLPAAGLAGVYTFTDRWAAYAGVYGTRLAGDVEGDRLTGRLTLGLGISAIGAAFNIYGCERQGSFRMVATAGFMGGRLTADLGERRKTRLYQLDISASTLALQAEWRPWTWLSFVPYLTGWRLLAVKQKLGVAETEFPVDNQWHGASGLDFWVYVGAESHLSLGMLFAFGGDKPVSTFTLSWTFVFGESSSGEEIEQAPESGEIESEPPAEQAPEVAPEEGGDEPILGEDGSQEWDA